MQLKWLLSSLSDINAAGLSDFVPAGRFVVLQGLNMKIKRLIYAALFVLLTAAEVLIGVFVHDSLVRPYVGDVIVVVVIYCFVRIFIPEKVRLLPLYVFIFSAAVELMQGLQIADRLGITSPVLRTIVGTVCDPTDIICYAVGCAILALYELLRYFRVRGSIKNGTKK